MIVDLFGKGFNSHKLSESCTIRGSIVSRKANWSKNCLVRATKSPSEHLYKFIGQYPSPPRDGSMSNFGENEVGSSQNGNKNERYSFQLNGIAKMEKIEILVPVKFITFICFTRHVNKKSTFCACGWYSIKTFLVSYKDLKSIFEATPIIIIIITNVPVT